MTLVNVDTHVGPDPKTHVSEMGNFMGRSTPSPAACGGTFIYYYQDNTFNIKRSQHAGAYTFGFY